MGDSGSGSSRSTRRCESEDCVRQNVCTAMLLAAPTVALSGFRSLVACRSVRVRIRIRTHGYGATRTNEKAASALWVYKSVVVGVGEGEMCWGGGDCQSCALSLFTARATLTFNK
ncbi:hypothetical protein PINS_up010835 [Pythium insidiosum]|nr:hypothetical protein PINS_up010835 [Pythium insidiosum]